MLGHRNHEVLNGSGGGAWSFNHGYDQFGNMWVSSASGLTAHSATPRAVDQFGATTNRLTKAFDGTALSNPYDEAGNLINHPYVGAMPQRATELLKKRKEEEEQR